MKRTPLKRGRTIVCATCGTEFYARPAEIVRGRRFCSQRCMGDAAIIDKTCAACGATFQAPNRSRVKACSVVCRDELKRRAKRGSRNPAYTTGWTVRRNEWLASAGDSCRICGSGHRLHLHHVVYEQHVRREHGDVFDPRNGLTLCMTCHMRHHHAVDQRIHVDNLRDENIEFARELLGDAAELYFIRYYDGPIA